ncbi:high-affinity Zn(2+) transporter zrt1 [Blyttiomyces sp. JEL0837]|nr:high-affinity Zn(2+) transporter zrt1 [Blyttiomyces sp. JEL0837]
MSLLLHSQRRLLELRPPSASASISTSTSSSSSTSASSRLLPPLLPCLILFFLVLIKEASAAPDTTTATAANDTTTTAAGDENVDPCAAKNADPYDYPLHIGAAFIIMGTSLLGTLVPILGQRFVKFSRITDLPFQCGKLFGAGVILATAFVHMFSPSVIVLTDPCLSPIFNQQYKSWAGALALLAALSTHLTQFLASRVIRRSLGEGHMAKGQLEGDGHHGEKDDVALEDGVGNGDGHDDDEKEKTLVIEDSTSGHANPTSQLERRNPHRHHHHHHHDHEHHDHEHDRSHPGFITATSTSQLTPTTAAGAATASVVADHGLTDEHGHHLALVKEKHITTYILELGIASHSVIIGLTLGVTRGSEFKSLIVAIVFHQFFEGLALSTVVLEANFKSWWAAVGMVGFYTFTTPIGIAVGIAINTAYNPSSSSALLTQGILDALSAGILAYDALVNIVYMHFAGSAVRNQGDFQQFLQLLFLWLGAFAMALVGRWA